MDANVSSKFVDGNLVFYDKAGSEIARFDGANRSFIPLSAPMVQNLRRRVTAAEINAGLTLLAAVTGLKYRLVVITLVAIGGNAAAATAVTISGTQATSVVALISAAVAALTRSAVVKPDTTNVTVLTDGVSFAQNDAAAAITIEKTGSSLTTATHVDVNISYTLEP